LNWMNWRIEFDVLTLLPRSVKLDYLSLTSHSVSGPNFLIFLTWAIASYTFYITSCIFFFPLKCSFRKFTYWNAIHFWLREYQLACSAIISYIQMSLRLNHIIFLFFQSKNRTKNILCSKKNLYLHFLFSS